MGEKTDMNRANEVRPMFRRLADVAERTGCAVILIGHLNKAAGGQSAYPVSYTHLEEDLPKLIGFLKRQETNGKFFSKAMQKEPLTDMEEV